MLLFFQVGVLQTCACNCPARQVVSQSLAEAGYSTASDVEAHQKCIVDPIKHGLAMCANLCAAISIHVQ